MYNYKEAVENACESLFGLFGENAPENAAFDIAVVYAPAKAKQIDLERLADQIWERYNELVKHREG